MKIFNPLQILHAVRHSGGMHKNALFKGCSTLVAMVTTTACSRPGASFSYKTSQKRVKCLFLYLKLNTTLQIGISTIHSNIIRLHFDTFYSPGIECEHANRLFISVQFWSFLLSGKTGNVLQKYTDSGTENTYLAGYNILVVKYVKLSAGLSLLFIGAMREKRSKSDIA